MLAREQASLNAAQINMLRLLLQGDSVAVPEVRSNPLLACIIWYVSGVYYAEVTGSVSCSDSMMLLEDLILNIHNEIGIIEKWLVRHSEPTKQGTDCETCSHF